MYWESYTHRNGSLRVLLTFQYLISLIHTGSATATTWLKARIPIFDDQTSPEAGQCASTLSVVEKYLVVNYFQDIVYAFDPIICEDG